jgi:hypothetical protein
MTTLRDDLMSDLQEILETMDVPERRKTDLGWLVRNLRIRNNGHPLIEEAMIQIKVLFRNNA